MILMMKKVVRAHNIIMIFRMIQEESENSGVILLRSEWRDNQPAQEYHKLKYLSGLSYESYTCNR